MKYKFIKISILLLALLAIFGTVGFGVYSYYYTQGFISYNSESFTAGVFDPEVSFNSDSYEFISSKNSDIELTCNNDSQIDVGVPVSCTGQINVKNDGDDPIRVKVTDLQLSLNITSGVEGLILSTNTFEADTTDFILQPTENQNVNFTANYQFDYDPDNLVDVTDSSAYFDRGVYDEFEVIGSVLVTASQNLED